MLLAAVRELAGPDPKLFPSAALVVNTLKVIQTLEQIGQQLQVRRPVFPVCVNGAAKSSCACGHS